VETGISVRIANFAKVFVVITLLARTPKSRRKSCCDKKAGRESRRRAWKSVGPQGPWGFNPLRLPFAPQ